MQYILSEDELRALKASNDVAIRAKEIAEDYRIRLAKVVLEEIKPFLGGHYLSPALEPHQVIVRLRAVFQSVPVVVEEKKS